MFISIINLLCGINSKVIECESVIHNSTFVYLHLPLSSPLLSYLSVVPLQWPSVSSWLSFHSHTPQNYARLFLNHLTPWIYFLFPSNLHSLSLSLLAFLIILLKNFISMDWILIFSPPPPWWCQYLCCIIQNGLQTSFNIVMFDRTFQFLSNKCIFHFSLFINFPSFLNNII
jgi:hypothetical protein